VKLTLGKLQECLPRKEFEELISHAFLKQNGVSLKYMLDFGSNPIKRQLVHSAQFLHQELPTRLAHRVAELENLPYGLGEQPKVREVRIGTVCWGPHILRGNSVRL
jgi:pyruvate dehydrogenase kinase 2/3/4